ncbi:MAG: DMT family transporter [Emcibacteraceae bacterium]|nr:DMT family transporter [Emcibacteraceae bacterium]
MEPYIFQALMGALLFGIGAMFFKWIVQLNGDDNIFFATLYSSGAVCFFIGGFGGFTELTPTHYISGALIGLGAAGGNYFFSKGLRHGPAGLTSAFAKANIVIVILISSIYYQEPLMLTEIIGIICFLAAMLIVNLKIGGAQRSVSKIWFALMVGSMILIAFRNGGLKVVDELEISSMVVMTLAYIFCAIFFSGNIIKNINKDKSENQQTKKVMMIGASTGVISYWGLYFYITALETGPGSVVVTIFSLDMLFVLLVSYFIYGERLNFNQKIGFLLSAFGFLLLGIK